MNMNIKYAKCGGLIAYSFSVRAPHALELQGRSTYFPTADSAADMTVGTLQVICIYGIIQEE